MKHPYNGILNSLEAVKNTLLQVCVYKDILGGYGAVVVLEDVPDQQLEKLAGLAQYARKKALMLPLIVTRSFIASSLDSYPLEFINIISSDKENLMCKEDLLTNLQFSKADVRLQMEREFKSKWLLTRQSTLEAAGRSSSARDHENVDQSCNPCHKRLLLPGWSSLSSYSGSATGPGGTDHRYRSQDTWHRTQGTKHRNQ